MTPSTDVQSTQVNHKDDGKRPLPCMGSKVTGKNGERDGLTAVEKGEKERQSGKGERTHSEDRETNKSENRKGGVEISPNKAIYSRYSNLSLLLYPTDNLALQNKKLPTNSLPIHRVGLSIPAAQIQHPFLIILFLPTKYLPLLRVGLPLPTAQIKTPF